MMYTTSPYPYPSSPDWLNFLPTSQAKGWIVDVQSTFWCLQSQNNSSVAREKQHVVEVKPSGARIGRSSNQSERSSWKQGEHLEEMVVKKRNISTQFAMFTWQLLRNLRSIMKATWLHHIDIGNMKMCSVWRGQSNLKNEHKQWYPSHPNVSFYWC